MRKLLQFFRHDHIQNMDAKNVVTAFATLAEDLAANLPFNSESTIAMRKLMEAKEAAVRAIYYEE